MHTIITLLTSHRRIPFYYMMRTNPNCGVEALLRGSIISAHGNRCAVEWTYLDRLNSNEVTTLKQGRRSRNTGKLRLLSYQIVLYSGTFQQRCRWWTTTTYPWIMQGLGWLGRWYVPTSPCCSLGIQLLWAHCVAVTSACNIVEKIKFKMAQHGGIMYRIAEYCHPSAPHTVQRMRFPRGWLTGRDADMFYFSVMDMVLVRVYLHVLCVAACVLSLILTYDFSCLYPASTAFVLATRCHAQKPRVHIVFNL